MSLTEARKKIVAHVTRLTGMTPKMCEGKSDDMLLGIAAMTVGHRNYLGAMQADALIRLRELEKLVAEIKQMN
jgi:hypothetical protein